MTPNYTDPNNQEVKNLNHVADMQNDNWIKYLGSPLGQYTQYMTRQSTRPAEQRRPDIEQNINTQFWKNLRPEATPPNTGYWHNPQRIGRYYSAIKAAPPSAQLPEWIDRQGIEAVYNYLQETRPGQTWLDWDEIGTDDPVNSFLQQLPVPPPEAMPAWEQDKLAKEYNFLKPYDPGKLPNQANYTAQQAEIANGVDLMSGMTDEAFADLPGWQRALLNAMPVIQRGIPAIGGAIMGGMAFGLPGAVAGAAGMTLGADAAMKNPEGGLAKLFNILNVPAENAEKIIGLLSQMSYAIADPNKYGSLKDIFDNLDASYQAGKIAYESSFITRVNEQTGKTYYKKWTLGKPDPEIVELPDNMDASAYAMGEMRRMISSGMSATDAYNALLPSFGDIANLRELAGNMLIDPLDIIADVSPQIVGKIGALTDNVRVADAFTPAGNMVQGMRDYGVLLRQMPADEVAHLSSVSKWIGGFDQAGNLKSLDPGAKKGVFDYMLGLTPKARATEMVNNYTNGLANLIAGETDESTIIRMIESIANTLPGDAIKAADSGFMTIKVGGDDVKIKIPAWFNSAEAQAVPNSIKDTVPLLYDLLDQYKTTRPGALLIEKISAFMGETPEKMIRQLHEGNNATAQTKLNTFLLKLDASSRKGDKQAGVMLELFRKDPELQGMTGERLKIMADSFFGKDAAPYNAEMFKLKVIEALSNSVDKYAVKWFDVKPSKIAIRVSDIVKRAQGYLLLGFNPSYLINNGLNNIFTLAWDGLLRADSVTGRTKFMKQFGWTPTRYAQGVGAGEMGDISATAFKDLGGESFRLGDEIRKAGRADDTIQAVDDFLRKGNKFQVAGVLSSSFEKWSSEIAMVSALKEYWARVWEVGKGIPRMSDDLRMMMEAVQPGLARKAEKLIKRGMNKAEIEKALFGNLKSKSIRDVLNADEVSALDKLPGLIDALETAVRKSTSSDEIRLAIANAKGDAQQRISEQITRNMGKLVEDAVTKAKTERTQGVLDGFDNMAQMRYDFWLRHFDTMALIADDASKMQGWQRQILWSDALVKADMDWKNFSDIEGAKYLGFFRGLGANEGSPVNTAVMGIYSDMRKTWDSFYNTRRQEMSRFYDQASELYANDQAGQVPVLWRAVNDKLNAEYVRSVLAEDDLTSGMDKLFIEQYALQFTDTVNARAEATRWRASVQAERRKMIQAQLLWRNGEIPAEAQAWGNLLDGDFISQVTALNGGQPLHLMNRSQRDKINPQFYKLYTKFIESQFQASTNNAPGMPGNKLVDIEPKNVVNDTEAMRTPETPVNEPQEASIPIMITAAMRQQLTELGYMTDDIRNMTPQQAWNAINNVEVKVKESEAPIVPEQMDAGDPVIEQNIWKVIAENKPELSGIDEAGNIIPDAKLNIIKYVNKWNPGARKAGLKFSEITADDVIKAVEAEKFMAENQPPLPIAQAVEVPVYRPMVAHQIPLSKQTVDYWLNRYTDEEVQSIAKTIENNVTAAQAALPEPKVGREATYRAIVDTLSDPDQAAGVTAIFDAIANHWAGQEPGRNADDWFETFIMGRGGNEVGGEGLGQPLFQTGGKEIKYMTSFDEKNTGNTKAKGFTRWLDNGQAILHAFESADVSTMVHEVVHVYTPQMSKADSETVRAWLKSDHNIDLPEGWNTTPVAFRDASEKLARGFERYLAEGKAPIKGLEKIFADFKNWMLEIYKSITGSDIDVKLNDGVRKMFDEWMGAEKAGESSADPTAPKSAPTSLINYSPNDISYKMAYDAHRGTSFVPEKRAKSEQNEYVLHLANVEERFRKYVNTPEEIEALAIELERYKAGYLSRYIKYLQSRSGLVSTMIAGRSNFPVARMEKINNRMDNALKELIEYSEKAQNSINRKFNPKAKKIIQSDAPDADIQLKTKLKKAESLQETMIQANKIIRKASLTDEQKIIELAKLDGISEGAARELLKPDFAGRIGFADYQTKNNGAEIRRLKQRIESLSNLKEKDTTTYTFDGGKAVENIEEVRLELFFDEKPDAQMRDILKKNGFKWSPSKQAWQRLLNNNAIYAARNILKNVKMVEVEKVINEVDNLVDEDFIAPRVDAGDLIDQAGKISDVEKPASMWDAPVDEAKNAWTPLTESSSPYKVDIETIGNYVYFTKNGELYKALVGSPADTDGYPNGARWEASAGQVEVAKMLARKAEQSGQESYPLVSKFDKPGKYGFTKQEVTYISNKIADYIDSTDLGILVRTTLAASSGEENTNRIDINKFDIEKKTDPLEIKLYGNRRLKIESLEQAVNLYKRLNKKAYEGFENVKYQKNASIEKPKAYFSGDWKTAIRLYGSPEEAYRILQSQMAAMSGEETFDTLGSSRTIMRLQEIMRLPPDKYQKQIQEAMYKGDYLFQENIKPVAEMTPDEMRQALLVDRMTGLKNRRAYEDDPRLEFQMAVDLEGLKFINDTYGHKAGDDALIAIAEALKEVAGDNAYRGSDRGDEFIAQFNTLEEARAAGERLKEVADAKIIELGGEKTQGLGLDYGIGKSLQEADAALTNTAASNKASGKRANRGEKPKRLRPAGEESPAAGAPFGTAEQMVNAPTEEMIMEGWMNTISPILDSLQDRLSKEIEPESNSLADVLPPDAMREFKKYMGEVYRGMSDSKMAANRYAESRRNFSLLDYSRRFGFDDGIGMLMPYQFWMGRSAVNWMGRLMANPSILRRYLALTNYGQDAEQREGFPQRLQGKVRIPLPFLPESMGNSIYVDPFRQVFPFEAIARPFSQLAQDNNLINRRAESILQEWIANEDVSEQDAVTAAQERSGELWDKAVLQAKATTDTEMQNPFDFAFAISSPSLPLSIAYNISMGRKDRISQMPITRTIQNMTAAVGIGGPRGINIEGPIRKLFGIPEVDRFEDYRVNRELSNMVAEGLLDTNDAINAMVDRSGAAFIEAQQRVSAQGLPKQFGSSIGLDFFPEGEQEQRKLATMYGDAIDRWAAGDKEALTAFWEENPEYEARMVSLAQSPEDQLAMFLRSKVWDGWNNLSTMEKNNAVEVFGATFEQAFLNSNTRSYDSISNETLAVWAKSLGQSVPATVNNQPQVSGIQAPAEIKTLLTQYDLEKERKFPGISETLNEYFSLDENSRALLQRNTPAIDEYYKWRNNFIASHPAAAPYLTSESSELYGLPGEIQSAVYSYRAQVDQFFPNIYEIQNAYFDLQDSARKRSYLNQYPELVNYWDWRRQFAASNPKAAPYIMSDESLAKSILGEDYVAKSTSTTNYYPQQDIDQSVLRMLADYYYNGNQLKTGGRLALKKIWESLGQPTGSLENWINAYVLPAVK